MVIISADPIKKAFMKVKNEFLNVRNWLFFLNNRLSVVENDTLKLKTYLINQQKYNAYFSSELSKLASRLDMLESRISQTESFIKRNSDDIADLSSQLSELSEIKNSVHDLVVIFKEHLKKDTSGHEKDTSGHEKDMSRYTGHVKKSVIEKEKTDFSFSPDSFSPSELYLLRLLVNSNKPLTYSELSRITGRKEKTIRNLIYLLRLKHMPIRSILTSSREKAFFVEDSLKVVLSGR